MKSFLISPANGEVVEERKEGRNTEEKREETLRKEKGRREGKE